MLSLPLTFIKNKCIIILANCTQNLIYVMKGFQVIKMKKTLSFILVLSLAVGCVFAFASCKKKSEIYGLAAAANPTKTVTLVTYTAENGDELHGDYTMEVEGNNSIFTYEYQRYRTVEDGAADDSTERIKTVDGVIYYKDGKFSFDGDAWETEVPTASSIKFDLNADYLTSVSINDTDTELKAELTPDNAMKVLGVDLKANGNAKITVKTNGVSLSQVIIEYTTADGAFVTIDTTYTYNAIALDFSALDAE